MYYMMMKWKGERRGSRYRARLKVLFLSDLGLRLLRLGALPSLCKSPMSLTLIVLLSLRLIVFGIVDAVGMAAACEEEEEEEEEEEDDDKLTLFVFNPDKISLMSLGPFISGLPFANDCLVGSREAWGLCGGGGGIV